MQQSRMTGNAEKMTIVEELSHMTTRYESTESALKGLKKEMVRLKREKERSNESLVAVNAGRAKEISFHSSERTSLEMQNGQLRTDLRNAVNQRSNLTTQLRVLNNNLKEAQKDKAEVEKKRSKGLELLKAYKSSEVERAKKWEARETTALKAIAGVKGEFKFAAIAKEKAIGKVLQRCLMRVKIGTEEAKRRIGKGRGGEKGKGGEKAEEVKKIGGAGGAGGGMGAKKVAEQLETVIDEFLLVYHEAAEHKISQHRKTMEQEHGRVVEKLAESFASATSSLASSPNSAFRRRKQTAFFDAGEEGGEVRGDMGTPRLENKREELDRHSPLVTEYAKSPFGLGGVDGEREEEEEGSVLGASTNSNPFEEHEHEYHRQRAKSASQPMRKGHAGNSALDWA